MKRFSLTSVLLGAVAGSLVGAAGTVALLLALGGPSPRGSDPATPATPATPAAPRPRQAPHRAHPAPTTRPDPTVTALALADVAPARSARS